MFIPHLHICGDCAEAIAVYEKVFNTKADKIIHNDNGGIVHAEIRIHDLRVMLNNRFGNKDKTTDCSIAAVITFNTENDLQSCYEMLKQDSLTIDPLGSTSFTDLCVQFLDKFGVQWAFMVEETDTKKDAT